ncbi:efflux RND transporter periplasmic adaptor subunit [Arenicella xantha]|uniref:Cobalt-zinc-cadmium efflux system membrane fusion protein n=1 Tax=Arenicella xantha TaxID=644221 RepID=A0A395JMA8_9GAMM|nr:efflux RND transporter periplasmic adaptor subunit [Arenicella xantha]RBP52679.1 cobalt-zinc-cadmium efflux system membrane fusion protein [Arenicella xantha]
MTHQSLIAQTRKVRAWRWLILACLLPATTTNIVAFAGSDDPHHDDHQASGAHDEHDEGSRGGKLLVDGAISVEMYLLEQGDGSRFQAWVDRDNKPVKNRELTLTADLTRLEGQVSRIHFTYEDDRWISTETISEPHSFAVDVALRLQNEPYQWSFESYEGRVEIAAEIASNAGITRAVVGPGLINQTVKVYGKAVMDPSSVSHVRARFPGTVVRVHAERGDRVKAGDALYEIESNESLQRYTLTSPLSGVVTMRNGNPGELAQQQVLMTVANFDRMWAEFKVFPSQAQQVSVGQKVRVSAGVSESESELEHLLMSNHGQPFLLARARLDNAKQQWTSGLLLEGDITLKQVQLPVVVDNRALQFIDEKPVVFVNVGNSYEARALELGLSDGKFSEVTHGLTAGSSYVVENSYLIKADLEKAGATHAH